MTLMITTGQRDALYDLILDRLSGIGDIELAIKAKNYEAAERLGREYSDDLRLLHDLGFGESCVEPVVLSSPAEVLLRALPRLREVADRLSASIEPKRVEDEELRERNRLISEACGALLIDLGSQCQETSQGGSPCA